MAVRNGQTGTLVGWGICNDGDLRLKVKADSGKELSFNPAHYGHIDYGYAVSVHRAQGQTVDNIYTLISEVMTDKEWSYVAFSRHRKNLRVFIPSEQLDVLPALVGRSRQKDVTSDYKHLTLPSQENNLEHEAG